MRILIAPDSFKESLPARAAARAMERGIRRVAPDAECILLPMADGGEGMVDVILHAVSGRKIAARASGPLGRRLRATYGWLADDRTAIIETAAASGLMRVPKARRNPLHASSYGTGELIAAAIARGAENIIIGLGGSATVDGGAGMAQALGVRFRDRRGRLITRIASGGMLHRIAGIDMDGAHPGIRRTRIIAAADVDNRLCGRQGAARVFGPQKGATPRMCALLDRNLKHFAGLIKKTLQQDVTGIRGGGAAGGLGAGLVAFAHAEVTSGFELVARLVDFERWAAGADLIFTGEGRIDAQTRRGKVVAGVARMGKALGVPVIAVGGSLADDAHTLFTAGIDGLASAVARDQSLAEACRNAAFCVANAAERVMRLINTGGKLKM
jgi:glycerate kinase